MVAPAVHRDVEELRGRVPVGTAAKLTERFATTPASEMGALNWYTVRRGETLAAWYLRLSGWRILARRVKTPRGEIDLVATGRSVERSGTPCTYYDSKNQKVLKGRTATDQILELYDRRTGKLVDKATFAGSRYAPFTRRIAEPSATSSSMSFGVRNRYA